MLPFNRDFKDLLSSFIGADVRFMVVGAYALAYHGHVRATKDLESGSSAPPPTRPASGQPSPTLAQHSKR
jgi:hypothetical protein